MTGNPVLPGRRGIVLILVTLLLVLLVAIGILLMIHSDSLRKGTRSSLLAVRANLLARSGVERALNEVYQFSSLPSYQGEDWNGDGRQSAVATHPERKWQVWRPTTFETSTCPLEAAMRPSFFSCRNEVQEGGIRQPDQALVDGTLRGFSGRVRASHADGRLASGETLRGDTYTLKVEDESGKINVNGGILDTQDRDGDLLNDHADPDILLPSGESEGWNRQLVRILNGMSLLREDANSNNVLDAGEDWNGNGLLDPYPLRVTVPPWPMSLGEIVVGNRPPGGYTSIEEVQALVESLRPGAEPAVPDLSMYLTVSSWVDRRAIKPNAWRQLQEPSPNSFPYPSDRKKARQEITFEVGGRPPINLNAADPLVLAVLAYNLRTHPELATGMECPLTAALIVSTAAADRFAAAVSSARRARPIATWTEFGALLDGTLMPLPGTSPAPLLPDFPSMFTSGAGVLTVAPGGAMAGADLVKANFDPNAMLQVDWPDECMARWLDKTDLVDYSTEGTFHPTGTFRISSLGRVTDAAGQVLASANVASLAEAFKIHRDTTQDDFHRPDTAGAPPRLPDGTPTSCFSTATALAGIVRTTGASASWRSGGGGIGVGVMSYPCPMQAVQAGRAAGFDGCVGLATTEQAHLPQATFVHHFDDGWTADVAAGTAARVAAPAGTAAPPCIRGTNVDALLTSPEDASVWPPGGGEPNTLAPDGAHLQPFRFPAYGTDNLPPDDAGSDRWALSFWVKLPNRRNSYYILPFTCVTYGAAGPGLTGIPTTQYIAMGFSGATVAGAFVESMVHTQDRLNSPDRPLERLSRVVPGAARPIDARWRFLTALVDTDENAPDEVVANLRGAFEHTLTGLPKGPFALERRWDYEPVAPYPGFDPAILEKMGAGAMVLGPQLAANPFTSLSSTCVLDEIGIYDFGDVGFSAWSTAEIEAATTYNDGRYYKGDDGKFLSSDLAPYLAGAGRTVRLLRAWWTERLPTDPHKDAPPGGLGYHDYYARWIDPKLSGNAPDGRPRVRLEIDLRDVGGLPFADPVALSQGGRIGRDFGAVRYRVRFRTILADPNDTLLETPFLDDITFAYQGERGPQILSWREP